MNLTNSERLSMILLMHDIINLSNVCNYLNNFLVSNEQHPLFSNKEISFFYERERKNLYKQVCCFNERYTIYRQEGGYYPLILEGHTLKNVLSNLS